MTIIVISHHGACWWYLLGSTEQKNYQVPEGWLVELQSRFPDQPFTFLNAYTSSLYWSITTLVTVGYGDITPVTKLESLYAIFYMIVCGFVFAFIMGTTSDIIQEFYD